MGHSMGGCVAALIESAYPGTFKGMYVYEPPFSTPSGAEAEAQRYKNLIPYKKVFLFTKTVAMQCVGPWCTALFVKAISHSH